MPLLLTRALHGGGRAYAHVVHNPANAFGPASVDLTIGLGDVSVSVYLDADDAAWAQRIVDAVNSRERPDMQEVA